MSSHSEGNIATLPTGADKCRPSGEKPGAPRVLVLRAQAEARPSLPSSPAPAGESEQSHGSEDKTALRLKELESGRQNLVAALEEMESRVMQRTAELEAANQALEAERALLESKNVAFREVLEQIDEHKRQAGQQLQTNISRVVRPLLQILAARLSPQDQHLVELLDSTLRDLMDPFVGKIARHSTDLTRREIEVANMIRSGFTSKQIASVLRTSVCTVHNQRRSIRKKLRIDDGHTNLESYLKSL